MKLGLADLKEIKHHSIVNEQKIGNVRFSGVSTDSRKCSGKDIFFAITGERFDGHDFVKTLFKKGIRCAVVSRKWYSGLTESEKRSLKSGTMLIVNNTVKTLGELAGNYRRRFPIPVIGIAGSNGKTSTKDIAAHVLSKKYTTLKTQGNLNNELGVPLTLLGLNKNHEAAIIELGTNHFGEVERLCKIASPQFGLITNIGKEHLEFLKDIRGAARAEGELAEYIQSVYGMFFLNADDRYINRYSKRKDLKKFVYGEAKSSDVVCNVTGFKGFYPRVKIKFGNNTITTQLNNIGYQSAKAAFAAAALGFYFEVPVQQIKKALTEYEVESNKRNQLKSINGTWIIDDTYNSNPDSVKAALENLKAYDIKGRKFIVLGDMLEMGKASKKEHTAAGMLIKKMKFENLLTYGMDSHHTYLAAKGVKNNFYFEDKVTLGKFLKVTVKKGDLVLVKGSRSMKMEEVIAYFTKNNSN
jgi:UDP-N-acetylmuramoyl-tripeptide--D-alanyl-D-alanine ligase